MSKEKPETIKDSEDIVVKNTKTFYNQTDDKARIKLHALIFEVL